MMVPVMPTVMVPVMSRVDIHRRRMVVVWSWMVVDRWSSVDSNIHANARVHGRHATRKH